MKKNLVYLFWLMALTGCLSKKPIQGVLKYLGNDTLFLTIVNLPVDYSLPEEQTVYLDTVRASKNKFAYRPVQTNPVVIQIIPQKGFYKEKDGRIYYPESNHILLYWEPGCKVNLKGRLDLHAVHYWAKGHPFNENLSFVRTQYMEDLVEMTRIHIELDSVVFHQGYGSASYDLFQRRNEIYDRINQHYYSYVLAHPDSELSGYYMTQLPFQTVGLNHQKLGAAIRHGLFKEAIDYKVKKYNEYVTVQENKRKVMPGKRAPDFTWISSSQEELNLYAIKSDFLVLDFWGSWCAPCLAGFPKMTDYYEKYRGQLEIVGIACKEEKENWLRAIQTYDLKWPQVLNEKDPDLSLIFAVENYPTKIILDNEKNIIATFVGEGEDFYKKLDELLQ